MGRKDQGSTLQASAPRTEWVTPVETGLSVPLEPTLGEESSRNPSIHPSGGGSPY